jgi:hypothetical protein
MLEDPGHVSPAPKSPETIPAQPKMPLPLPDEAELAAVVDSQFRLLRKLAQAVVDDLRDSSCISNTRTRPGPP